MQNSKKTFIAGLNTDDSFFAHKQDDHVDAMNARVVTSAEGKSGSLSNITGNRLVTNTGLLFGIGDHKVVGTHEDATTNDVFYFVVKEGGYSYIFVYKTNADAVYTVVEDVNFENDYKLNFQETEPITAIAYIDGLLYWSGVRDREPCRINVERGIKLNQPTYATLEEPYEIPIKKPIVTVIRKPPMMPLNLTVEEDADRDTSFLKSRTLTFAYRYVYRDGEISVFSPSTTHYPNQDMDHDEHETSKKIRLGFPLNEAETYGIADDIEKIQYAVKFDKDTSYFVWKEFTRKDNPSEFTSQTSFVPNVIVGDYYNDVLGSSVDDSNSIKLYDTVPYEAEALEIGRNRLFLGNIKEGLLNPRRMTIADMDVAIEEAPFDSLAFNQEIRNRGGIVGFACSSAYQVGLAFYDFAGRTGGVLTDDSVKVITSERNLVYTTYNSAITYQLNNSAQTLIPEWATHYAVCRTKNLTKDFTIGNLSSKIRYYQYDSNKSFTVRIEKVDENGDPTGKFSDNEFTSFSPDHEGIAIGLGDLTSYKQGYSYQEGDRIKLITDSRVMEFAITGTQGRYVLVNLVNLNGADYLGQTSLANADYTVVYEIYSPHKIQPNEFYYEGVRGRITNPGTPQRNFDQTSGTLIGDVYLKARKADTSSIPVHFAESSALTANAHDEPFKGLVRYIGFPYFYGSGLNDLSANTGIGSYYSSVDRRYEIKITDTSGAADKFQWRARPYNQRNINHTWSSDVTITGGVQTIQNGLSIEFENTTGHVLNDKWAINCKTQGNQLGNVNSRTYSHFVSPPNGVIYAGSEVKVHQKEYRDRWPSSDQHHEFTVTMTPAEITENYATIEELFWETSFGTKLTNSHYSTGILFRRGTIQPAGDDGKSRMYILDSEANNDTATQVSKSDGTLIHLILRSQLEQGGDLTARVETNFDIRVDLPDEYSYSAEAMNPSDDYFLNWTQITGRPNLVPGDVESQNKVTGIVFSETKIPGSKVNGLSKFSALDEDRLDDATGPLRTLKITSKTQSTGTVMLAISENETTSIYLGEQQLQQASSGNQFLSVTKGVIGTKNALQGSFGTLHPESVVVNEGKAYWYDVKNATVVKYDSNGLMPIGDIKMKTFFKEKSDIIVSDTFDSFVPGTYDAYNNEYILTLPKTGETNTTLQGPVQYGNTPVQTHTNTPGSPTPHTGNLPVRILEPWGNSGIVSFVDGVGVFNFNAQFPFKILENVVYSPSGSGITVANETFAVNGPGFNAGQGGLRISGVNSDVTEIVLKLTQMKVILPRVPVSIENPVSYSSKFQGFNYTPIRLVEPSFEGIHYESKTIEAVDGTLTIPFTSNFKFKLGDVTPNSGFSYTEDNRDEAIPIANISTNATRVGTDDSLHYYAPGSWNLVITGINSGTTGVDINSRKLIDPQIITLSSTNITTSGLRAVGELNDIGTGTEQERGFVYCLDTDGVPQINGTGVTKIVSTSNEPIFNEDITGLTENSLYNIRAYIITEIGTAYGNTDQARTGSNLNSVPTVTTTVKNPEINSIEGQITADGGAEISEKGFLISKDATPVIGQPGVIQKRLTETITTIPHDMICSLEKTLLDAGTTYYFRAYAINNIGTSYGQVQSWTTESATSGRVGFIDMITSSVPSNGGNATFTITKTFDSGSVSGVMLISDTTGNSNEINFTIPSTESSVNVQYMVSANSGSARQVGFTVESFTPSTLNGTGSNTPILIKQTVSQNGSPTGGGGYQEINEQY